MPLLFLLLSFFSIVNSQTCEISAGAFYGYADVINCFRSVPFSETVRSMTLNTLEKSLVLYAFADIAADPPNARYDPVNLLEEMDHLNQTNFKTDFDFHVAVKSVYLRLHDPHTNYFTPLCYGTFAFYQPFALISYVESGTQVIAISDYFDPVVKAYYSDININLDDFAGAKIVTIDDIPAVSAVYNFAYNYLGTSKDPQTRFNLAVRIPSPFQAFSGRGNLGWFSFRTVDTVPPPTVPTVTYQIQFPNGTTSFWKFQWIAKSSRSYRGFNDFSTTCWAPSVPREVDDNLLQLEPDHVTPPEPVFVENSQIIPIVNSTTSSLGIYQVGSRTMVMYVGTFSKLNETDFFGTLDQGIDYGLENGLDRLIIDLSLNGGGHICTGMNLINYLFPTGPSWNPSDMPSSPLAQNLTRIAMTVSEQTEWTPSRWTGQNGEYFDDISWMIPGVTRQRGRFQRNFSQLIHLNCGGATEHPMRQLNPSQILILTHGFCGSTCAMFANHLHQFENVKTLVVGGTPNVPQGYSSFPGSEVLNSPEIFDQLDTLYQETWDMTCVDCLAPRRLITSAYFRICIREIFGPDASQSQTPLEYTFLPADYKMDNTLVTAQSIEEVWPIAATYFSD